MTPQVALISWAVVAVIIATISSLIGAAIVLPPRGWQALPWPQRARLAQAARVAPALTVFIVNMIVTWVGILYFSIIGWRPTVAELFLSTLPSILALVGVAMFVAWVVSPRRSPLSHWLAGCMSAVLFGYPNTVVVFTVAAALVLLPHNLSMVLAVLFMGALGSGFAAWGGGIWVARALGLAQPALPRAAQAVDWAAERVGERPAAVYELRWPRVTIDAFTFSRYLVITDAAAELLRDEELLALATRELTFFQQPWLTGTLRVADSAVVFVMLACMAIGVTVGGHAMMIGNATGFGAAFLMRPLVRRLQLKADALAARAAIDPASALRALERQYELNLKPVVSALAGSREPHLYDRMIAAGIPPAYPRPEPPSKLRIILSVAAAAGACVVLSIGFLVMVLMAFGR
jgi:hypothetical protein